MQNIIRLGVRGHLGWSGIWRNCWGLVASGFHLPFDLCWFITWNSWIKKLQSMLYLLTCFFIARAKEVLVVSPRLKLQPRKYKNGCGLNAMWAWLKNFRASYAHSYVLWPHNHKHLPMPTMLCHYWKTLWDWSKSLVWLEKLNETPESKGKVNK